MQEHHEKALRGNVFLAATLTATLLVVVAFTGCGASTYQVVREDRPVHFTMDDGEISSEPLPDDVEGPRTVETRPSWCSRNRVGCALSIVGTILATGAAAAAIGVAAQPEYTHVGN